MVLFLFLLLFFLKLAPCQWGSNPDSHPSKLIIILKADRLHPRNYPQMPTHYRHTDNHLRLVMVVVAHCCTRQSRVPNIDHCAPEIWPWPLTFDLDQWPWPWPWPRHLTLRQCNSDVKPRILAFDLDLWPTTLTYNPNLANVNVDLHTEYQGHRSNGSGVRVLTDGQMDGQMDGRALPSALSPCFDKLRGR